MQRKRGFWEGALRRLDVPREALPFGYGMTVSGREAVTVNGCRRILTYGDTRIRLAVGRDEALCIEGGGLLCTAFRAGCVTVEGRIDCLRFEKGASGGEA